MTRREIAKRIYLTGHRGMYGYTVVTKGYDGTFNLDGIATARMGHAIVRTLRQMAYERPDLFPALPC